MSEYSKYIHKGQAVIPDGLTEIGSWAFSGCSGLTSIEIPSSVTKIGSWAFSGCSGLTSIEIPSSVTEIGDSAFSGCSGLTSIEIPNSVKIIGWYAFSGCSGLTSIKVSPDNPFYRSIWDCCLLDKNSKKLILGCKYAVIPDGVETIGEGAFCGCSGLPGIEIPNSVTEIGARAFSGCSSLTSIEIPNSVKVIKDGAFSGCSGLTSIEIPDSVEWIGEQIRQSPELDLIFFESVDQSYTDAFSGCFSLTSIKVSPDNPHYKSVGNCLLDKNGKKLIFGCKDSVIPNSVDEIKTNAFSGCSSLTSIEIPNSVTEIGGYAFEGCSGLTSIEIPNSVTKIGGHAFSGCSGLTSIEIPNSVTEIGWYAFSGCSGLTSIEFFSNYIGRSAFKDCEGLQELIVHEKDPQKMASILYGANLSGLDSISVYVPIGTGYAYRHNEFFSQFKEIIANGKTERDYHDIRYDRADILEPCIQEKPMKEKYVFFDTETTGLPEDYEAPSSAINNWPRMIQLSWITTDKDGAIIAENDHIIYPDGFIIPQGASKVNGITTEVARTNGDPIKNVLESFMKDVENAEYIVGHNVSFDIHVVGAELIRMGKRDTLANKPSICTMQSTIDFCAIPGYYGYKYPKLQELHKKLFNYEFEDAHNALSDIRATLKCFIELKKRNIIKD